MILDLNATEYIKKKEPICGYDFNNSPYYGFVYPKSKKQLEDEKKYWVEKAEKGEKINLKKILHELKEYYNCYLTYKNGSLKIISENEQAYESQNFRYNLRLNDEIISVHKIKDIIQNKQELIDDKELFDRIIKEVKKYVYLKHKTEYYIIGLYIMLTYKYLFIDFMPILHLNGEAGTGKSQIGKIIVKLGFNGCATVSTTKSSFFRRIDRKRGVYFMDEKETLEEHEKELLNGCTYEGSVHTVTEKQNEEFIDLDFQIYTPIVLACISEIYGATSTRTIKIETCRPPIKSKKYPVIRLTQDKKEWRDIRDSLLIWSLQSTKDNIDMIKPCEDTEELLSNRGVDAWKCLIFLSKKLGIFENISKYISNYYLEQIEEIGENDLNYKYLKYLYCQPVEGWFLAKDLYEDFCLYNVTDKQKEYFTLVRFGKLMRRIGFSNMNNNKRRSVKGYEYLTDKELVRKYIINNYEFSKEMLEGK